MDYANQRAEIKMPSPRISSENQTKIDLSTKSNTKRSFDVAFLMRPDDKMKNRQNEKHQRLNADAVVTYPSQISVKSDESLRERDSESNYFEQEKMNVSNGLHLVGAEILNNNEPPRSTRFVTMPTSNSPRVYDDPTILPPAKMQSYESDLPIRSAFTKVPHARQDSPPPLSPDQMSCPSSSPPISTSPPRHIIYQSFRPEYRFVNNGHFHTISQMQAAHNHQKLKQHLMYRPIQNQTSEIPNYMPNAGFPFGSPSHPFPQPDLTGIVRNPAAAALLTTLIPPTIATSFTLTAQNVCAKCNISFRMTSDLVYHMRSHHKSEFTNDTNRRKREEKLKCPVCNESFRERHHLTRHMTAHQDKASDEAETIQIQRRQK